MSRSWAVIIVLAGMLAGRAGGEPAAPATDQAAIRKHVATLRAPRATAERIEQAVGELVALGEPGAAALGTHLDRELARLAAGAARPKTTALDEEIDKLRDTLRTLRGDPELSKERLQEIGLPALESLTITWTRREAALAPWRAKRAVAAAQAERLALLVAAWQAAGADGGAQERADRLAELQQGLAVEDPEAVRVAAENERIAASLPADVVPGMMAVNAIRLTCGLSPLVFDPKLCDAAVMHSGDMERHGFFAHESPLPGKETPWDRAKLAGTTASGENIYMGSTVGSDAIKAWFLSPGHHKNMFGEGHTRQGLGRSGKHWTQLFGAE